MQQPPELQNYPNWTSGNAAIDDIIRRTQQTSDYSKHWEWIDPQRLENIIHFKDGGFGSVYVAVWKDGTRNYENSSIDEMTRSGPTLVVIKTTRGFDECSPAFLEEVMSDKIQDDIFYHKTNMHNFSS